MLSRLSSSVREAVSTAAGLAEAAVNQTVIRVAVTGLSRAGKTVFMTSLINNLAALGRGYNTLPKLRKILDEAGSSRLRQMRIVPAGSATIPYFDSASKLSEMAAENPVWPPRTDDLAQVALDIEIERSGSVWTKLGPRRIRLELLDYPGEWLLDLPLLSLSFPHWSRETLQVLRTHPRESVFNCFLNFLEEISPEDIADDASLRRGHSLYAAALLKSKETLGLRHLQPGRFLCPGPHSDAPYMWFFPMNCGPDRPRPGTVAALLRDRFEAYKHQIKIDFFDTHFTSFNRQIVLVDVLGALRAGKAAFEDTQRAITDISRSMAYRSGDSSPLNIEAALRAGKAMLGAGSGRQIERVAFAATKADHVPALRRKNLENLLRDLVEQAGGSVIFNGQQVSFHTVASVLSTRDDTVEIDGRTTEVVRGVLLGEKNERAFFPGEVPSGRPPAAFWENPFFELPSFKPPRIDPSGRVGIVHLGLDDVLASLLRDVL